MESKKMRSRQYTDLTNWEIESYLERSDIIIIPVGHCETLGATPVDGEYVMSHAYATLIAEEVDGLVLPNVTFTCPGGTQTGRGTIHMSVTDSIQHTLALAHSLMNQGFRRMVWIPSHGPTKMFLLGMVTQFFDETKLSMLYLDTMSLFTKMGLIKPVDFTGSTPPEPLRTKAGENVDFGDTTIAAYDIVKRLDIYPAKGEVDFPEAEYKEISENFAPWFMDECKRLFWCSDIACPAPFYFQNCRQHGGDPVARYTREELKARARIGRTYLEELVHDADFPGLLDALGKLNKYMRETSIPAHKDHLPKNRFAKIE